MPFPPQPSNGIAGFWLDGQATIPPPTAPDVVTDIWTGKPKVALNEWQFDTFGAMFFLITVAVDTVTVKDHIQDPNGLGSTIVIVQDGLPTKRYYYVRYVWPVMFENETQFTQMLCVDAAYV